MNDVRKVLAFAVIGFACTLFARSHADAQSCSYSRYSLIETRKYTCNAPPHGVCYY